MALQTGSLFGTVSDFEGQKLPGVTITLTSGGPPLVQVTDPEGRFRFPELNPGHYTLKAELEGFDWLEYPDIEISAGRRTEIELTMQPAVIE